MVIFRRYTFHPPCLPEAARLLAGCLLLGLLFCAQAQAASASGSGQESRARQERIISFRCDAVIQEDGTARITEHIRFESAGKKIRRGLVRVLPQVWKRPDGQIALTRITLGETSLNSGVGAAPVERRLKRRRNDLEVFLGRAGEQLKPGIHEYTIEYVVENVLVRENGRDFFYWNVTGDWDFSVNSAVFRLALPGGSLGKPDSRLLSREFYTGSYSKRGKKASLRPDGGVATTESLRAGQGLTVVYSWPSEITAAASSSSRNAVTYLLFPAADSWPFFLTLLSGIGYYAWYARKWRLGPPRPVVVPDFRPPKGVSPGALRHIVTGKYDYEAFAADLLWLVNRQALFIRYGGKGGRQITLSKKPPEPAASVSAPGLSQAERGLLERLFPQGTDTLEIGGNWLESLFPFFSGSARRAAKKNLAGAFTYTAAHYLAAGGRLLRPCRRVCWIGFSLMALMFVLAYGVFFDAHQALIMGVCVLALYWGVIFLWAAFQRLFSNPLAGGLPDLLFGLPKLLFVGAFAFVWVYLAASMSFPLLEIMPGVGGGLLLILLACLAALRLLPRRTAAGRDLHAKAMGLKLYLKAAEQHRFQILYPPEENIRHFEELLPYALALDVGKTWAGSFAAFCKTAQTASSNTAIYADFNPRTRLRGVSGFSSLCRTYTSGARRSSSSFGGSRSGSGRSGGGGFSGGGAGGGGGRGW